MKVVLVADQLACGGAEQQVVTLARGLHRRRHQVHVVSIFDQTELRPELDAAGVPITVAGRHGKYDFTTVLRLRRLLAQINPDLVHAYLPAASFFVPMTRWLGIKAPILQSERGVNSWRGGVRLQCDRFVRRSAVHLTCNAEAIKRYLVEAEGVDAEKITVIYNGLRGERLLRPGADAIADARDRMGAPLDATIVVCVANLTVQKRHDVLLSAFRDAHVRNPRLFLVLIGRGPLDEPIRQTIRDYGLDNASRMFRDCSNPAAYLCASHIKTLTSDLEGCSNAILEAMAMALPAVVTDAGGNRELIIDARGGHVCPVGDHSAIAESMLRLAAEPDAARRMGEYNLQRVRESFTDDVMVTRNLTLYERLAATSAPHLRANDDVRPFWQRI
jgi:glycosyltransferase involved in cell wall biosynthesis